MLTAKFKKFEPLENGSISIMLTIPEEAVNNNTLHELADLYKKEVSLRLESEMPDVSSKLDTLRGIRAEVGRVMGLLDDAIGEGPKQEAEFQKENFHTNEAEERDILQEQMAEAGD